MKYKLSSRKPTTKKKIKANIKGSRKRVKKEDQGFNDGLDEALGIPKKKPDFGLVTGSKKRRRK